MKQKFTVTGMTCSACSAAVEKAVKKVEGVESVSVNLLSGYMSAEYDQGITGAAQIMEAVERAGYAASVQGGEKTASPVSTGEDEMKTRLIASVCFLIPLMYLSMQHMLGYPIPAFFTGAENAITMALTQFLLTLPIIYLNRRYFTVGFKALFHRAPNMDSLIAIGALASVVYGVFAIYRMGYSLGRGELESVHHYLMNLYFESAGMILTLITVGKYLETRSKGKTGEAIAKLMDLAPKTATVIRDNNEVEIPVEEVRVGDTVVVRPGARIPVDGVIIDGSSFVDQSALTGESIPALKKTGDTVNCATINKSGYFLFRAEKVGEDTTLSQIIRLVEEAGSSKAPIAKLADRISGVFVPIVICIAVVTFAVWMLTGSDVELALSSAISVLVISCPCALGLATPVAIMAGVGKGAEHGILVKSAEALETASSVTVVVLDKTGTITEGKPTVTDVFALTDRDELLAIAAAIERKSEHPLAEAVAEYGKSLRSEQIFVTDFEALSGRGIRAFLDGELYFAGNEAFMSEKFIDIGELKSKSDELASEGKTPLFFADRNKLLGMIAVADVLKPTAAESVKGLREMGKEVIMLTGDNKRTAEAIGRQAGVDRTIAEVMPADKEMLIRTLQQRGEKVMMVGDGINDSPALARADVGVAIGAGTDIAIESADIVLIQSDPIDAVKTIRLSKAVMRNIKQNLFWAFFYNTLGIPLAAGVFYSVLGWRLNPAIAAAAMSLSSFCVVTNALRLRTVKLGDPQLNKVIKIYKEEEKPVENLLKVGGMSCQHCVGRMEKALTAVPGVTEVKVDLESGTAKVKGGDPEALKAAVIEAGYDIR